MPKQRYEVDLLLDSGAFSAWQRGLSISVRDYIAYLKEHQELLTSFISLDVIPGAVGQKRDPSETKKAAAATYKNHQRMLDAGLEPIPVFHQGEPEEYLQRYVKDGEPYIGVSLFKDYPARMHREFLDRVFSMITDREGRPLVKVHGFATTNPEFLFRYPFHSVDSTTWSLGPSYGHMLCPVQDPHTKEWDYSQKPIRYVVSGVQQKSENAQKFQVEALEELVQGEVRRYLEEEVGISVNQCRYDTVERRRAVLTYFLQLAAHAIVPIFEHKHMTLNLVASDGNPIRNRHCKIYFATTFKNRVWARLMTDMGARTRLLNFWEMRNMPDGELEAFVKTGLSPAPTKKAPRKDMRKHANSEWYKNMRKLKLHERVVAHGGGDEV